MIIGSPAGIGDWSWLYSALYSVRDEITKWEIADGAPYRTVPYVKLACPDTEVEYGLFNYQTIIISEHAAGYGGMTGTNTTWAALKALGRDRLLIQPNKFLEHGCRLEDWLPDLPTEFHYPLHTSPDDARLAVIKYTKALSNHPMTSGPTIAISCASYKGARAWDTWERPTWVECIRRVMSEGWRPIMIGGCWDDLTSTVAAELELPDMVGQTSAGELVESLKLFDSYLGFSSGLNVIRTVLNRPAMALWPCNDKCDQLLLSTAWAPPHMLETRRYSAATWRPLSDTWPLIRRYLRICEDERNM